MKLQPALDDFPSKDATVDTARVMAGIEAMARAAPAQYLWIHRRFKRTPDGVSPYACRSCGSGLSSGFLLALPRIKRSRLKPVPRETGAGTRNFPPSEERRGGKT